MSKEKNIPQLNEGDLLNYLSGDVPPEVRATIEASPELLAQLSQLQQLEVLFAVASEEDTLPSPDELLAYSAKLLPPNEQAKIEALLQENPQLSQELNFITPPPNLLEQVTETPQPMFWPALLEEGKRILQAVLLPSSPQPAFALRGPSAKRQVYQADDYQILVALTPPPPGHFKWQVEGQIAPTKIHPLASAITASVWESQSVSPLQQDNIDEFGYFALADIPPGHYTLKLSLPETVILLEDFSL